MYHSTYRIIHTTAFVTPVVEHWLEREIAEWVHHEVDSKAAVGGGERRAFYMNYFTDRIHYSYYTSCRLQAEMRNSRTITDHACRDFR